MNRSAYFLVMGGALAGVIFVAACTFVFVAGAYRPPPSAAATLQAAAAGPAAGLTAGRDANPTAITATAPATAPPAASADPERGRILFSTGRSPAPPCSGCHATVKVGRGFAIGPNLAGVADRAATRIEGLPAEAYLRQSILQPRAFVAPGFRDMMFTGYAEAFSDGDVADVVAYLMTLHEEDRPAAP